MFISHVSVEQLHIYRSINWPDGSSPRALFCDVHQGHVFHMEMVEAQNGGAKNLMLHKAYGRKGHFYLYSVSQHSLLRA